MATRLPQAITPDWVKDAVFYQIFPDRFAKSTLVEKPHNLEAWDTPPTTHGFKGGDLLGVQEHLDYLQDLGITAIYFTPIFQSTANHRYHTYDYFQVDPVLGGNAAFKALLAAAHARGIRIVLDGVFNHASRGFYQFNHTLENGRQSPYLDWFTFKGFPVRAYDGRPNYEAWWNLPDLPKFNHSNPQVREFIYRVADYWVREGIDGWRLDVPGEIDDDAFWREFRRRVKAANPEAYIVGEIWQRANRWLMGDQFDAVMNYQFTRACVSFCVESGKLAEDLTHGQSYGEVRPIDAEAFAHMLDEAFGWYPAEISYAQMNLLGSHDTARFLSIAQGDISALKLALFVMLTYPGAPCIYYGDEIGMLGRKDPDSRRSMIWDDTRWNRDLFQTVKNYIALRKKYPSLRRGQFASIYGKGKAYAFLRRLPEELAVVGVNAGRETVQFDLPLGEVPEGTRLFDAWSGETVGVGAGVARGFRLPPRSGAVWIASLPGAG